MVIVARDLLPRAGRWSGKCQEEGMTKVIYQVVEHNDGWAYQVDGVFSETFPVISRHDN